MRAQHLLAILPIALAGSCASPVQAAPASVVSLIKHYAPALRLGMPPSEVQAALPGLALDDGPSSADLAGPDIDGFSVSRVRLRRQLRDRVLEELELAHRGPTGMVEAILLSSTSAQAAASAERRISQTLGIPPRKGCGGFPGVALDRVLSWRIDDEGGVMLTIPSYRSSGGRLITQLVFFAGPWRPETVVYDYRDGACPSLPR